MRVRAYLGNNQFYELAEFIIGMRVDHLARQAYGGGNLFEGWPMPTFAIINGMHEFVKDDAQHFVRVID